MDDIKNSVTTGQLVEAAIKYQRPLACLFNNVVSKNPMKIYIKKKSGEELYYDGPSDYTNPDLRRVVIEGIVPKAHELLETAKAKNCETAIRQLLGVGIAQLVERQDVSLIDLFKERARSSIPYEYQTRFSVKNLQKFGVHIRFNQK